MRSQALLQVTPSRTWLLLWLLTDVLIIAGLWGWSPWPPHLVPVPVGILLNLLLTLLLLAHALQGWRHSAHQRSRLQLKSQGELALLPQSQAQSRSAEQQDDWLPARLDGRAGISAWCCRFSLQPRQGAVLPPGWRHMVMFRDSMSESDYRALCRWLVAQNRQKEAG